MRKLLLVIAVVAIGTCAYRVMVQPAPAVSARNIATNQTQEIARAASAFLDTLSPEQRRAVLFAFTPQKGASNAPFHRTSDGGVAPGAPAASAGHNGPVASKPGGPPTSTGQPGGPGGPGFGMGPPGGFIGEQYGHAIWSNFPVSDVLRPGLRLGSLSAPQKAAVMHMLQTALSSMGFQKVLDIMGSDQALSQSGQPFCSGTACYTVAIFGQPSDSKPWMIEFGGHHLGLNLVIAGEHGVITPTLTGAQPAVYQQDGKTVRVLAQENDKAFALLDTLDANQRKQAVLNYDVDDLVLGPGHAGQQIQPEGLKGSAMSEKQKTLLLDIIRAWAGIVNDAYAAARMAEVRAGLDQTYFAWSGPTTHKPGQNGSSYYRIQGPKIIIEFSPQGVGGDKTMHVHTIYRDPTDDYGVTFNGAE